jgi:2-oxoglutarate/2-oxoacid ferredoxin oxidoreductase subunit alpha
MVKTVQRREQIVIRFAGDSGDGMQLTGDRFAKESAALGNNLSTQPSYPAEIRAPAGTIAGVSSYQVKVADHDVFTAGDPPDVLVAMNPAALKANVGARTDLRPGAVVIVDADEFTKRGLGRAGYAENPLTDGSLTNYDLYPVPLTSLTLASVKSLEVSRKDGERAKNMFALGLVSWMFHRPIEGTVAYLQDRFGAKPLIAQANLAAFRAGYNYGETTEAFAVSYEVAPAELPAGRYRSISGNVATSYGLLAAARRAGLPLFIGSYPITPATDILQDLVRHRRFGVDAFQAEDEIGGICSAIGASFGGALGVTTTSGPGLALKTEALGLAVSLELPLVVVDVQRGGPSTGLPTKTEQSDLLQAVSGRNGEAPLAVLAAASPSDCFDTAVEAVRIATTYRTPVIMLTDATLANGSQPWLVPTLADLPDLTVTFTVEPNGPDGQFLPYRRDPQTLARPWAVPGTPGLEHRLGGLEKLDEVGSVSHDPDNHDLMVRTRAAKIDGIAASIPPLEVDDPGAADGVPAPALVLGWGSSHGPVAAAVRRLRRQGVQVAHAHLRHLHPMPANTGDVLRSYPKVIVPELNLGQLAHLLRARYLVDVVSHTEVRGMALRADELVPVLKELIQP